MAIKVQHIIGPYQTNKTHWLKRVVWMHKQLLQGIQYEPVVISQNHTNIVGGLFGVPEDQRNYDRGQRALMAATVYFANDPHNELYVLLNDDGEPAPEVATQARAWQTVRTEAGYPLNIFVGTWKQWLRRWIV